MMTENELCAAFERIHPSHRELRILRPKGKTHWVYLKTVPDEGSKLASIPLVHFELGHGSAQQLAEFMVAAMAFARERYIKPKVDEQNVPPVSAPDEQIDVRLERRGIVAHGTLDIHTDNSLNREHFKEQLREIGLHVTTISFTPAD